MRQRQGILQISRRFWLVQPAFVLGQVQPLGEAWMMEHRSPEARVAAALRDAAGFAERLPGLAAKAEAAINRLTEGGLEMHPDTVRRIYEERARHRGGVWLLWLAAGLVLGALLFG